MALRNVIFNKRNRETVLIFVYVQPQNCFPGIIEVLIVILFMNEWIHVHQNSFDIFKICLEYSITQFLNIFLKEKIWKQLRIDWLTDHSDQYVMLKPSIDMFSLYMYLIYQIHWLSLVIVCLEVDKYFLLSHTPAADCSMTIDLSPLMFSFQTWFLAHLSSVCVCCLPTVCPHLAIKPHVKWIHNTL